MTYQDILHRLNPIYGVGEARAITRLVLEERFLLSLTDIMLGKVTELSREESEELEKIIQRLENHEPVQYILGYQDFCGHRFHVEPGVLIPRPETELLIEETKLKIKDRHDCHILDIGTGSGCIAITLALMYPEAKVEAWDISDDALRIAKGNADRLGAKNVTFRKVDILEFHSSSFTLHPLSFIISNPPYICRREASDMDRNVLDHEPDLALFVPDDNPLLFYRAIAVFSRTALSDNGQLIFEINRAYGREVCDMLRELGYKDVEIMNDQFDNPRIVICKK